MAHGGTDSLLPPALDAPDAGVQWVSVARIVKAISDAGIISKQLRWSIKARLTSGEIMITLNTLTVIHTLSLNCSKEICKQLSDSRYMRMLEKAFTNSDHPAIKAAVVQILVDWRYLFRGEETSTRSEKLLRLLKSKGAKPIKESANATERREDIIRGVSSARFARGLDFGLVAAKNALTGSGTPFASPRSAPTSRIGRLTSKLFARSPTMDLAERPETAPPSAIPQPSRRGSTERTVPAQVEAMLHQMPSDMKKLKDLVSDIHVLHSKGGDDNDIRNKFAVAQSLASKCKGWGDRVKHIITTHVEDVSIDCPANTPRGDKQGSPDDKTLDDAALTKILDANDKVQVAMKGWYELEKKMSIEWAKNESFQSASNAGSEQQDQPTTIMDAISHQLRTAQRWNGIGGGDSTGAEHVDSMSSDTTHSFSLQVAPSSVNGTNNLWVDFSDSSGSQLSRQSPGAGTGTPAWKAQSSLHTPREGWTSGPRRSSGKGRLMGTTSPDLSSYITRPHSMVSGTIVPHFSLTSPFSATAGVYGTPRLVQTETAPHKPEFKHSASLPRNFSTRVGIESNDSEYGSCESKELSGTSTWHSAKSSLKERLSGFSDGAESGDKKDSARKLSSCPEKIERQKTMPAKNANLGDFLDASMPPRGLENRATIPFAAQKSAPTTPVANGLERHTWCSEELVCSQPRSGRKRTPSRRIPPALRVRFTPEHLKDVLGRVGECPALSSTSVLCKMPVTRL